MVNLSVWREKIERWHGLSGRDRKTVGHACLLLPVVSLSLKVKGLKATTTLLGRRLAKRGAPSGGATADLPDSMARLVAIAARYHPYKTACLAQSLTLWYLLARKGVESEVRIGVTKVDGVFGAHAWIEVDGKVYLDGPDVVNQFSVIV